MAATNLAKAQICMKLLEQQLNDIDTIAAILELLEKSTHADANNGAIRRG